MRIFISAISLIALSGCATNSGIVDLGGGNYVYEKEDAMASNGSSVKVEILKEAAAFCKQQGKILSVQSSSTNQYNPEGSYAGAEVQFSCK